MLGINERICISARFSFKIEDHILTATSQKNLVEKSENCDFFGLCKCPLKINVFALLSTARFFFQTSKFWFRTRNNVKFSLSIAVTFRGNFLPIAQNYDFINVAYEYKLQLNT